MKIIINILKMIIITALTICIISIGFINVFSRTILNKQYVINKMENMNFYEEVENLIEENFENYIYQSGLDEETLKNICSKEKIKNDINIIISNIYDGTNKEIDTTEIKDNLNSNIEKTGKRNSKNSAALDEYINKICDEYTKTILHTSYENNINEAYTKVVTIIHRLYKILCITAIILFIIIIIINNKKFIQNFKDFGIALMASSAFIFITNIIINMKVNISAIRIFNDSFSNVLITIIKDIFRMINIYGIIALIISLIFTTIYSLQNIKPETKKRPKH